MREPESPLTVALTVTVEMRLMVVGRLAVE
jgi:hypothetical protein